MKRTFAMLSAGAALVAAIVFHSPDVGGQGRELRPGDPIPGLTPREMDEFRLGQEDFTEVETSEEGLGPAFRIEPAR